MPDYSPVFAGEEFPLTASAAITAGQIVEATGNSTCAPAAAASLKVLGVAAFDAASGARVTVFSADKVNETLIKSGTTLTAGNPVMTAANGQLDLDAAPAILKTIGVCISGGVGDGTTVKARWIGL